MRHLCPETTHVIKTLKYGSGFLDRFESLSDARAFVDGFTQNYNHHHRHTGLGLHTPADIHYGLAAAKATERRAVLEEARARYPHRFTTNAAPKILNLPGIVYINGPTQNPGTEKAATADGQTVTQAA